MRTADQDVALCAVIAAAISHAQDIGDDATEAAEAAAIAFVAGLAAADAATPSP